MTAFHLNKNYFLLNDFFFFNISVILGLLISIIFRNIDWEVCCLRTSKQINTSRK